jgi:hypothetical protein
MILLDLQKKISQALLSKEALTQSSLCIYSPFLTEEQGIKIYKNNFEQSLLNLLKDHYPLTRKLLGNECFETIGRLYIYKHPPESPFLDTYGDGLSSFLVSFPSFKTYPYIKDIACLEKAMIFALSAWETFSPLPIETLHSLSEKDFSHLFLEMHPYISFVTSSFPLKDIVLYLEGKNDDFTLGKKETYVIVFPFKNCSFFKELTLGTYTFLRMLHEKKSFLDSITKALKVDNTFNLQDALYISFTNKLFINYTIRESKYG